MATLYKDVPHVVFETWHDQEFLEVRWMSWSEAASLMTFETERNIVDRSRPAVDALRAGPAIEPGA